jgi:hypothetical protein
MIYYMLRKPDGEVWTAGQFQYSNADSKSDVVILYAQYTLEGANEGEEVPDSGKPS